jgi:hypothetical protein
VDRSGAVEAVELMSDQSFGDVPVAEPDGRGGYIVVAHVWRGGESAADQYQLLHLRDGRVVRTFGIASGSFTDGSPFGRFRLAPDGALYQLTTSPDGTRIVRFDWEDER